jgi:hypothetical protein
MDKEFVVRRGLISLGGITFPYIDVNGTYTISQNDYLVDATSGTFTITLPTAVGIEGKIFQIKNSGTGVITLDGNGSETIDGQLTITLNQYDAVQVTSNGTNWVLSAADLLIVENPGVTRVLLSDGTRDGAIAQTGLTYSNGVLSIDNTIELSNNEDDALPGQIKYNEDKGFFQMGMVGGSVIQDVGGEQYYYIKNQTGGTLLNGRVIRAAGTLGSSGRILGDYMIADGTIPARFTMGVATEDILDGNDGYVTEFGLVRGINATGAPYGETWINGDVLYVSPTISGGLTKVEPQAPELKIVVALVINNTDNGSIFVRPSIGGVLGDLHNVQNSGQTNGDLLVYNLSTSVWEYSKVLVGNYTFSGYTTQYGNERINSGGGTSLSSTTIVSQFPITSGHSANFEYFVKESGGAQRSGVVMSNWNTTLTEYTDFSTEDLGGDTSGIQFETSVSGGNLRLTAVITSGTWNVYVGTRIIF